MAGYFRHWNVPGGGLGGLMADRPQGGPGARARGSGGQGGGSGGQGGGSGGQGGGSRPGRRLRRPGRRLRRPGRRLRRPGRRLRRPGRRLRRPGRRLRRPGRRSSAKWQPLGELVSVDLELAGLKGQPVFLSWSIFQEHGPSHLPGKWLGNFVTYRLEATTNDDTGTVEMWIPLPKQHGPYFLRLTLTTGGATLASMNSSPFDSPRER